MKTARSKKITVQQSKSALEVLPQDDDMLIRRGDVKRYIPIEPQTLARWAVEGTGPRMTKIGRRLVCYRAGDLRAWLTQQQGRNAGRI